MPDQNVAVTVQVLEDGQRTVGVQREGLQCWQNYSSHKMFTTDLTGDVFIPAESAVDFVPTARPRELGEAGQGRAGGELLARADHSREVRPGQQALNCL